MKTHRWLTLAAALLITLCEVLLFNSQSTRERGSQADAGVVTDVHSGQHTSRSPARAASNYWAAAASEIRSLGRAR